MARKKGKNQPSNVAVSNQNGESSDSNDVKEQNEQCVCSHIAKSVDFNQMKKSLKTVEDLKKNFCPICVKESKARLGADLFICLKCGTKTCCTDHALVHFKVPHSTFHALAYDVKSQIIWCFSCNVEIKNWETKNNKLTNCITSLNHMMTSSTNNGKAQPNERDLTEQPAQNIVEKGTKKWQAANASVNQSSLLSAPVRGLSNLGNTCYFNSVMQCLARTKPLITELEEMDHKSDIRLELNGGETLEGSLEKWDLMSECLHNTLISLLTPGSVLNPSKFLNFVRKKHPQFEGYDQHDAHELLRHTLDSIRLNDLKRYRRLMLAKGGLTEKVDPKEVPKEVSKMLKELEHKVTQVQSFIPEKTFKGKLVSRVECQECHHSSECIEGFLDLSLPILADKPHPPVAKRKVGTSPSVNTVEKEHAKAAPKERVVRKFPKKPNYNSFSALDTSKDEVQEADAEPVLPTFGPEEDKPHESGYSSEKASSSLRGSPSSEEVCSSSSTCDDTRPTTPQLTTYWLTSLPEGFNLAIQNDKDSPNHFLNRPPTSIPLHSDGSPDLSYLNLHDSMGTTLNLLCLDTSVIMEQEPNWQSQMHARYFSNVDSEDTPEFFKTEPLEEFTMDWCNETSDVPREMSDNLTDAALPVAFSDAPHPDICSDSPDLLTITTSKVDIVEASNVAECTLTRPSCLSEIGKPAATVPCTLPFRKMAIPLKNFSKFSPVKEECSEDPQSYESKPQANEIAASEECEEVEMLPLLCEDRTECNSHVQEDRSTQEARLDNEAAGDKHRITSNGGADIGDPTAAPITDEKEINSEQAVISSYGKKKDNREFPSECSVESCLRQFTSIEFMTGSNKVGCSACTERQNKGNKDGKTVLRMATKQLLIGQAPPILVLHLKRFQVLQHSLRKLSKHISFPLILDIAPFRTVIGDDSNKMNNDMPMPYNLFAIVEHRGTLYSGHYVAYVKTEEEGKRKWYCISDSHITEVTEDRVLKTEAYLLFYSRLPTVN